MTKINIPTMSEVRGYVMLMMMRRAVEEVVEEKN
jgi:hypothetical protein